MAGDKRSEFENYFADILEELEKEFTKSDQYSKKVDDAISMFEESGASKGAQHYLIEHIKNAISLQSQRQSLIKDKFGIKKAILDYAMKRTEDETSGKELFEEIERLVKMDKEKIKATDTVENDESLDDRIDEILDDHND
jgi:hypothetical protein